MSVSQEPVHQMRAHKATPTCNLMKWNSSHTDQFSFYPLPYQYSFPLCFSESLDRRILLPLVTPPALLWTSLGGIALEDGTTDRQKQQ